MRVAFVVSDSIDQAWGHRTHILEVRRELARKADVRLYLPRPRIFRVEEPGIITVPVIDVPAIGLLLRQFALFCRILLDAHRFQPQIIYARHSPLSLTPLLAAWCLRIPLVIELNALMAEDLRAERVAGPIIRLSEYNEALACRLATGIVAVSNGIAGEVARLYGRTDSVVIANGVDCTRFVPCDRTTTLHELGLDPDCRYICFVGNLAPWQGLGPLIEAMAMVVMQCRDARLLIVGAGDEEAALRKKVRDFGVEKECLFIGSVPNSRVPAFISAATVCVAPFERRRNEKTGLSPLKLYEYMACARAIVTTLIPGVDEIIRDSEGGVLVPPDDPAALAGAMVERLSDPQGSDAIGNKGRHYVTTCHCWSHVADRIFDVLVPLVNDPAQ